MKIGYARVSTIDQNPNAQRDALKMAQIKHARKLIQSGEQPTTVADSMGVNRSTLYGALKHYKHNGEKIA